MRVAANHWQSLLAVPGASRSLNAKPSRRPVTTLTFTPREALSLPAVHGGAWHDARGATCRAPAATYRPRNQAAFGKWERLWSPVSPTYSVLAAGGSRRRLERQRRASLRQQVPTTCTQHAHNMQQRQHRSAAALHRSKAGEANECSHEGAWLTCQRIFGTYARMCVLTKCAHVRRRTFTLGHRLAKRRHAWLNVCRMNAHQAFWWSTAPDARAAKAAKGTM